MADTHHDDVSAPTIVVTGATGFIGERLLSTLLQRGHKVRAVSRRPRHQTDLPYHPNLSFHRGDALRREDLAEMVRGCEIACITSFTRWRGGLETRISSSSATRRRRSISPRRVPKRGVSQIVYVSGLKPTEEVSAHLRLP